MSKDSKVYTAVLLPWLKLDCDLEMGKYRFIRWPQKKNEFGEFSDSLNNICGMYKYIDGRIENPQTIVMDSSKAPFERIEGQERQAFQEAVTILTTALIGENEFFSNFGNYINYSLTELHFQNFSIGEDYVAFTSYKRDGHISDMGYKFDEINISTPPGCRTRTGCKGIDQPWLNALGKTIEKKTHLDRLIIDASNLFCQANTDSPNVLQETEVVMMANAFDRLFPNANGRYQLSENISKELNKWINIKLDNSNRLANRHIMYSEIDASCSGKWDIVQYWMLELYSLRNSYVHGNDITQQKWGWIPSEHLLMGAYIFPLILKVLLSRKGKYQLSNDDQYKLHAIDDLLDLNEFYDRKNRKNLWRKMLMEVRWNQTLSN